MASGEWRVASGGRRVTERCVRRGRGVGAARRGAGRRRAAAGRGAAARATRALRAATARLQRVAARAHHARRAGAPLSALSFTDNLSPSI